MPRVGLVYLREAERRLGRLRRLYSISPPYQWLPEELTADLLAAQDGRRGVAVWVRPEEEYAIYRAIGEPWRVVRSLAELEGLGLRVVSTIRLGQRRLHLP